MKIIKLRNNGDTIVEVLMSIAVISLVLSISYGLANRSSQTNRQAQERSEAQKITEEQLELLRGYVSTEQGWGTNICFKDGTGTPATSAEAAECANRGSGDRYRMLITFDSDPSVSTYTVKTNWENTRGGTEELVLSYKLPVTGDIEATPPPPGPFSSITAATNPLPVVPNGGTTVTWTTESTATYCDPVGFYGSARFDPRPSLGGSFSTGPLTSSQTYRIQCFNNVDTPGNVAIVNVEIVAPKIQVVARKIPPNSDSTTPSCGNSATQNKGGSVVTLNPGGDTVTTSGSNSSGTFTDLAESTNYTANVNAPSGYSVCPPGSQSISTGGAGTTQQLNFKIVPNCYVAYTAPYYHVTYWHDHGYDYPVYATAYWWQHTGPGGYYGRSPFWFPNPYERWEANSVGGGPSPVYVRYAWPGPPANGDWRNRYELWSGTYIAYWDHYYDWHYHQEDYRGDPYNVCP